MEGAVVDKIVSLVPPALSEIGGLQYSSKPLTLVKPPQILAPTVYTLDGLLDLIKGNFEDVTATTHLIHVVGEAFVAVAPRKSDGYAQRTNTIEAHVHTGDRIFTYGQFLDQETAIIGLQACFVPNNTDPEAGKTNAGGDIDYVLGITATLASEEKLQVQDNGVNQTVTAKASTSSVMLTDVPLKPRVSLAPYRTFREVEQPKSDFILRVRKGSGGMPAVGLFEADGGAWRMDAIHNVRDYLKAQLPDWTIVA